MRIVFALLALGFVAACDKPDTAPGPGGVTMGEDRALDEAAAMLDERRPPAAALAPSNPQDSASSAAD